jgi:uroporphyrinogen-III decarboxylase
MCGKIDHLLDILMEDLGVEFLNGFGFPVDRRNLKEKWAGRVVMRGGLHPDLLLNGAPEAVTAEVSKYIETAGALGGYIVSDGYGLAPGTPIENLQAVLEAANRPVCPLEKSAVVRKRTHAYAFTPSL